MAALPMIFLVSLLFPSCVFWVFLAFVSFCACPFNLSRCLSGSGLVVSGLVLVGSSLRVPMRPSAATLSIPCFGEAELFQVDGDGHRPEARPSAA